MDHIQALRTIAEYPVAEQDDMPAANMRKIAIEALERLRSAGEAGEYPPLPEIKDMSNSPQQLNLNDRAMWVIGWNECRDSVRDQMRAYIDAGRTARAQAPAAVEPVADHDFDWEPLPEDSGERAMFDRNLELLYGGDPRVAIATALSLWANTRGNGSFGLMCAVFANEVVKLHIAAPSTKAEPAPTAFGDEEHVLVPRGLIGAACHAISEMVESPKTLAELRRYTTGDLSEASPADALDAETPYQRGFRHGYNRRCDEIAGDLL